MAQTDADTRDFTTAGLNLIAQALSIYDRDLRLSVCNRPFQTMFDLPPALVTPGARFEDTIRHLVEKGEYGAVDDPETFVRTRVDQARAFQPHYMERTRSNGRTISVEGSPLPQGGWVTVYTDITRTKRSESLLRARSEELSDQLLTHAEDLSATNRELAATITALEETKRQLTEAEARTRLTAEMMPAHIAHVDAGGFYTYSNRRLGTVIPYRGADLPGRHIRDVLGPAIHDRITPSLNRAYGGEASVFEFTDRASARRIRTAFTPDGRGGVYILSMDITQETQTRVALQQTRRRALAAQMVNGLAHDFANLLTIILGLQSRLERTGLSEDQSDLVKATVAAARRGGGLLNRIGDMTGHRTYRARPTDLHALLRDMRVLATPTLPPTLGLSVVDTTPDTALMLDAGMLQDALLNLILNARDACGASGQITIAAHAIDDVWIDISVTDTGPGFSDAALDQALNPFFTTKGGKGSGLGLPMVYDMVKLAGGDLRLSNTATGACVTLRLPWRAAPAQTAGGLALLVEDDDSLRADIRDMLVGLDYSVVEAASVDEAIALTADLPGIALVLSDLRLEGDGTGIDLADRLGRGGLPLILMTSLPPDDPLHRAAQARAPVLSKPFRANDLARLLRPEAAA